MLYQIKQDSADGRLFIWSRCIELIKEHPLFGYGVNGFHRYYMSAQADYFRQHPDSLYVMLADNITHPFNEYLKLTVNYGLIGFFSAIVLLIWIVIRLFKSEMQIKVLGLSYVASIFVMCQFSYPFRYAVVWLISLIVIIPGLINKGKINDIIPWRYRIPVAVLLLVLFLFTLRSTYYNMKWAEMAKRSQIGQFDRMMKYYDGMPLDIRQNPLFLFNYAAELNYSGHYEESLSLALLCVEKWNDYDVQILLASNYAFLHDKDDAIRTFDQAYHMIPGRLEPLYGKMLVYDEFKDSINVIRIANEINETPIKVRSDRALYMLDCAHQKLLEYDE